MTNALLDALEHAGSKSANDEGESLSSFLASLATSIIIFAVEFCVFLMLKGKLTRIYQPRTYLVPDRERTEASPPGLFRWVGPVFSTPSAEFIQKSGLDAYFFLRYLRMLLKIFIPLAVLLIPVLIPINRVGGKGTNFINGHNGTRYSVTGLDQLAWGNVRPSHTHRYWAHLIMAIIIVAYVCAIFFDELRVYIRMRQAYMTSPQHRLRASATTVLVTSIPTDWLNAEALNKLFGVFPGGVRNIWINRDYDELHEKVKRRRKVALKLEAAETSLIRQCKEAQLKQLKAEDKKNRKSKISAQDRERMATDRRASQMAMGPGVSSGNPHQAHTLAEVLHRQPEGKQHNTSDGVMDKVFDPAIMAAGAVGQGVGKLGKTVLGGFKKVEGGIDNKLMRTGGFVESLDYGLPRQITPVSSREDSPPTNVEGKPTTSDSATQPSEPSQDVKPLSKRPSWVSRVSSYSKHSKRDPEIDEQPLTAPETPIPDTEPGSFGRSMTEKQEISQQNDGQERDDDDPPPYPVAYNEEFAEDDLEKLDESDQPLWKKYIKAKDRDTWRLPWFKWNKWPTIWLIGTKVDTINYCRKELARLNLEIEVDQQHPERFPLMNSAFIQFNHQVAAHMACQSLSHHLPKQMAPRIVEISPDDVIWDNMSMKWWERYLRTFTIITIVCVMVISWAIPVAFTGLLSQLSYLEGLFTWLSWLSKLPSWLVSAIQGVLPTIFLAILMAILPVCLRFLCKRQGVVTGMAIEMTVQNYYFAFLFVQLFLVVTISSSIASILEGASDVSNWPTLLANDIPKASNYFFSYMILRAMSVSAGALMQIAGLIKWFILAPILDKTARKKWTRMTTLNRMKWGSFFPMYTTLASIGMIYCVVAPLILVFNVITFGAFWFVYRYRTLYVTKFRFDTGGLLFPRAINQLFTGLYVMELALIVLFFLVRDENDEVSCKGQGIIMCFVLAMTIGYQVLLNDAFGPLIRYIPITLEDDAIRRDNEFQRAQHTRLGLAVDEDGGDEAPPVDHGVPHPENDEHPEGRDIELKSLEADPTRRPRSLGGNSTASSPTMIKSLREKVTQDTEGQEQVSNRLSALFAGIHDELEDLTPEERDQLVQRAFQHEALRAKRPVIWIPRDDLGVSDDEVHRTQRFSKHIWVSNEYQGLDGKCRAVFSRSPPDFSELDIIQL
ncbi:hypothetical protein N7462_008744 [Penicillium macrosclerotiorum]|uniref:uncharacterized protein n=1 Tax=Penicillium macrosclerotiorum TaxID=303699 RepID=UPI0025470A08|nr:uncharacterized protein N7462_008744 [Penicillium macrosclerotiorum]KAJ5675847.1 hypothetical protein N7462_008744 [Penicillium macrosclerotiorum]